MFQTLTFLISLPAIIVCLLPSRYFKPSTYDEFISGLDSITIEKFAPGSNFGNVYTCIRKDARSSVKCSNREVFFKDSAMVNSLTENIARLYLTQDTLVSDRIYTGEYITNDVTADKLSITIFYNHRKIYKLRDQIMFNHWGPYELKFTPTFKEILDSLNSIDNEIIHIFVPYYEGKSYLLSE